MKKEVSKVQLSKREIGLLREKEFFEAKRKISGKIYHQFADLVKEIKSLHSFQQLSLPPGTDYTSGKISRGENYLGLPFIILDFPRLFTNEKILAFRTMVWWGNFLSCTLIVSADDPGHEKELADKLKPLEIKSVYFCIADSPWHHHFGEENYVPLSSLTPQEIEAYLSKNKFLKVARKIPLDKINRLREFSTESFELFASLL